MRPNYKMPLDDLTAQGKTTTMHELRPGVRVGIGDAGGTLLFRADGALHLETQQTSGTYDWAEISISLSDPAWHSCRRIHVQITASANPPADVMPALRLHQTKGFHDLFPSAPLEMSSTAVTSGHVFDLTPRQMAEAEHIDLQIFLSQQEHELTLFDVSAVGTE